MEELSFKPVTGGYVFQTPNPWLIGPRRHYLVNEAQKTELAAGLRRMWRLLLIAIIGVVVAGVPAAGALGLDSHPVAMLAASAVLGLAVGVGVTWYALRPIQRLLAGLAPTDQRITQRDALATQIRVFSRGYLMFYGLLSLALFLLAVSQPLLSSTGSDLISILGAVLFGASTLYWVVLYIAKRRRERGGAITP
jgi:predicted neutral ceramidase superfamily lipid hydrolase